MTTLAKTFELYKPKDGERIPLGVLGFVRGKLKNDMHALILHALEESGISQAELARRLGKRTEVVNRNIGGAGNWTLNTVSDLLFAINGTFVSVSEEDLIDVPARNHIGPEWLFESDDFAVSDTHLTRHTDTSDATITFGEKSPPSWSTATPTTISIIPAE